ncbi:hypothetical protein WN943_025234 [Citrus x changshan-huyou]
MHIMVSNVFGFQKEPLLTLKDPKSFGFAKIDNDGNVSFGDNSRGKIIGIDNVGIKEKEKQVVLGQWMFKTHDRELILVSRFAKTDNDGNVSFGDNSKGKIIGIDNVGNVSSTLIENGESEGEEREAAEASKKREVVKFSNPKLIAPPPMKLEVEDFEQNPAAHYLKVEETVVSKGTAKTSTVSEADDSNASSVKLSLARFPDAARPILPSPIELEAEEPTGRTSNLVVLWQMEVEM